MSHTPQHSSSGSSPRLFDSSSKLIAGLIFVLAVGAGVIVGLNNPFLGNAASSEGSAIDALFSVMVGIAMTIFVIVQGFLFYSILRFGGATGEEGDGPPVRGNARLEVLWTAIPAIIVVFIAVFSYRVLADIERPQTDELVVEVTGRQYAWEFYYPEHDLKTNQLHLPLDRQALLKMRSADVIHSFWVPEFRIKKDVMPDRVTDMRITPTEAGVYPVVCAELCGAGHAIMRAQVYVQPAAEYQAWLASAIVAKGIPAAAADPAAYGRQLFTTYGCNACHVLADAGAVGQIGPKLDGLGARAAGIAPGQTAEEYVRLAIIKPNEYVVQGYQPIMPQDYSQRMSDAELEAMIRYLLLQK